MTYKTFSRKSAFTLFTLYIANSFASNEKVIEEVFVTAQKRDENLLSVPISINVIQGDYIGKSGAFGLSELETSIPSINFGRGGRRTRGEIAIRGVGGFARNIGSQGRVVVYVDDVPLGRSTAFDANLANIEQIEILKGPQGTLFGANTIAGAINITSKSPLEEHSHSLRTDFGDRAHSLISIDSNIPVSENLLMAFQLGHRQNEGHISNSLTNQDLQGSNVDSTRLKLLYSPTDKLTIHAGFDWLKDNADATNAEALADATFAGVPLTGFSDSPNPNEVNHDAKEFENRKVWGTSFKAEYVLNNLNKFISITAYRSSEFSELSEEDYSAIPLSTSIFDEEYEQWSQEFRLVSAADDYIDYVVGLYLQTNDISTGRSAELVLSPTLTLSATTPGELKSHTYAIFGNVNYQISDQWKLTTGARYQYEDKEIDYSITDTTGNFDNGSIPPADKNQSFSSFHPKISLSYESENGTLTYTSIATGGNSGGWNADFVTDINNTEYNSEKSIGLELGYKNKFYDERASFSAALFHTKFSDFQVLQFRPAVGAREITNAGKAKTEGAEFELLYYINDFIDIQWNTNFVNAEYTDFKNGGGDGIHYDGNKLAYAPELTSFFAININKTISPGVDSYYHFSYSYSDGYFSQPANNNTTDEVGSYFVINGHMGLTLEERFDISLWGRNLTDEQYLRFRGLSFLGVQRGYYEEPRTLGISITTQF